MSLSMAAVGAICNQDIAQILDRLHDYLRGESDCEEFR